jgi:hypothetical protein
MTSMERKLISAVRYALEMLRPSEATCERRSHGDMKRSRTRRRRDAERAGYRWLKLHQPTYIPKMQWPSNIAWKQATFFERYGFQTGRWVSAQPNFVEVEKAKRWMQVGGFNVRTR